MHELRNKMIALGAVVALGAIGILTNPTKAIGQPPGPPGGGVAVNLVNPLPVPVRTVNASFEPVFVSGSCSSTSATAGCFAPLYTVPVGKRLVVEYFSVSARLPAGDTARFSLAGNTVGREHFLPLLPPAAADAEAGFSALTSGGQVVRMYFEPLDAVRGTAIRFGSVGFGPDSFQFKITGYLMNVTP